MTYTIGDLAREFGATLRTLRFYEDRGILAPRRNGQARVYGRRDRARLQLALLGKRVGFSLTEIKEMLDLYDLKDHQVTQLSVALERFDAQIGVLKAQRVDIDAAIEELGRARDAASRLLADRQAAAA